MGVDAAWVLGLIAVLSVAAAVLWNYERQPTPPPPVMQRVVDRRHRYGVCPGCGKSIVQALCDKGGDRIFDAEPWAIADDDPPLQPPGKEPGSNVVERWADVKRRAERNNKELWIFDPSGTPVMRPFDGRHVRGQRGLTLHACALNPAPFTSPQWQQNRRWN